METQDITKSLSEYNDIFKEESKLYQDIARDMGLSQCSFWILYALRTEGAELTQSEICAYIYEPKQTVNSALKKLEGEGCLILRQGNDRRSKRIALTPSGRELCARTVDRVIDLERTALAALTEKERRTFLKIFRKYTDLLKTFRQEKLEDILHHEDTDFGPLHL